MPAELIDGRARARELKLSVAGEMKQLREEQVALGLGTISVGAGVAATAYERKLRLLAEELDVAYVHHPLPATASLETVLATLEELNTDPTISGILMLRPLPGHIDEATVFRAISPGKDIEAVHPENAGLLALGAARFVPSTAASAFHLLDTWLDTVEESRAEFYHRSVILVVGRSNNVGKPATSLAYEREAAVESVDEWASRTTGLGRHTRHADILIVAAGQPGLIQAEHVNEHAVVIDVGINPVTGPDGRTRMIGDVDRNSVEPRARALTPVPGGVGPVTDVWLLHNTALAARLQHPAAPDASQITTPGDPA